MYLYSMNEHTQLNRLRYIYCNMFTHWNGNMFGLFFFIHMLILWSKLIHIFLDILHGDHNRFSYLKAKASSELANRGKWLHIQGSQIFPKIEQHNIQEYSNNIFKYWTYREVTEMFKKFNIQGSQWYFQLLNLQGSCRDIQKIEYTGKSIILSNIKYTGKWKTYSKIGYTRNSMIFSNIEYTGK